MIERAFFRLETFGDRAPAILASLHARAFPEKEVWSETEICDVLAMSGVSGWVAVCKGTPCGFVLIRQCLEEAEVLTLAVDPDFQRQSVGRALMGEAMTFLKEQGAERLFLEVSINNQAAKALYQRLQFEPCGHRKRYYPDGSDALVLRYDLATTSR